MHDIILAQCRPDAVRVSERYVYSDKISGVRQLRPPRTEGRIEVTIPYDGRRDFDARWEEQPLSSIHAFGRLQIVDYGLSRLQREPVLSLERDRLLLELDSRSPEMALVREFSAASFDIRLTQHYSPEEPAVRPLEIEVEMLDEVEAREGEAWQEELERHGAYEPESVERMLVQQAKNQVSFERSLLFRFRIRLHLPANMVSGVERALEVERVSVEWPVATSPRLARVRPDPIVSWARELAEQAQVQREALEPERREELPVDDGGQPAEFEPVDGEPVDEGPANGGRRADSEWPVVYDPERGVIEWYRVPLYPLGGSGRQDIHVYETERFQLAVEHPGKLTTQGQLAGSVTVRLQGAFSRLQLDYVGRGPRDRTAVPLYETTLVNHFSLNLQESFEQRFFSPQQHLQFPGIILDEMRVADVLMLLKDQRFELMRGDWLQRARGENGAVSQYLIEARRAEGTGFLHLWVLIQGTPAETTRERQTLGQAKYTTELDTGRTVIYMRGRLRGDATRVVAVMNELQAQLKKHFRHVGTVD